MGGARDQINDVINPIKYHSEEQQCGRISPGNRERAPSLRPLLFPPPPSPSSFTPWLMDDANNCALVLTQPSNGHGALFSAGGWLQVPKKKGRGARGRGKESARLGGGQSERERERETRWRMHPRKKVELDLDRGCSFFSFSFFFLLFSLPPSIVGSPDRRIARRPIKMKVGRRGIGPTLRSLFHLTFTPCASARHLLRVYYTQDESSCAILYESKRIENKYLSEDWRFRENFSSNEWMNN